MNRIYSQLQSCEEAVQFVYQMEKKLYEDSIISLGETDVNTDDNNMESNVYSNKSLIQLAGTPLVMASTPDLCKGVLYIFPVKLGYIYMIR